MVMLHHSRQPFHLLSSFRILILTHRPVSYILGLDIKLLGHFVLSFEWIVPSMPRIVGANTRNRHQGQLVRKRCQYFLTRTDTINALQTIQTVQECQGCAHFVLYHFYPFFMIPYFFAPLDIKLATLLKVKLWLGCCLGALLVRVCCRLKDVSPYKVSGWGRGLKYRTKYTCSLFNTNPAPSPKEILRSFQQKSATHFILSTQISLHWREISWKNFGHRWLSTLPAVTLGAVKMSSR